jgi:hypothetical protein
MDKEGYRRMDTVRQTAVSLQTLFAKLSGRIVSQAACSAVVEFRKELTFLAHDFPLGENGAEERENQLLAELIRVEDALSNCVLFMVYDDSASFLEQLRFFKGVFLNARRKGVN